MTEATRREAVCLALLARLETLGVEVERNRLSDVTGTIVSLIDGPEEVLGDHGPHLLRIKASPRIFINTELRNDDGALNALIGRVQSALCADPQLGGLADDVAYRGIEEYEIDAEGADRVGSAILTFEVVYAVAAGDPSRAP